MTTYAYTGGGQPVSRGWDVEKPARNAGAFYANATLSNSSGDVDLFVHDASTDFSLAGSTAQSSKTRSFFPRNFTQQAFRIMGQCVNQEDFGNLAEFVHQSQRDIVNSGDPVRLRISSKPKMVNLPSGGKTKGEHTGLSLEGYVNNFARAHKRFEYSPEYQFDFVVSRYSDTSGAFDALASTPVIIRNLRSWTDIVNARKDSSDFITFYNQGDTIQGNEPSAKVDPPPPPPIGADYNHGKGKIA